MRTVILGASPKPERYAYKALQLLAKHRHETVLVNPAYQQIDGQPCLPTLTAVAGPVDTLTVYLDPSRSEVLVAEIIQLSPRRVIFNPGSESTSLAKQLAAKGIDVVEACTLVLLQTGQY